VAWEERQADRQRRRAAKELRKQERNKVRQERAKRREEQKRRKKPPVPPPSSPSSSSSSSSSSPAPRSPGDNFDACQDHFRKLKKKYKKLKSKHFWGTRAFSQGFAEVMDVVRAYRRLICRIIQDGPGCGAPLDLDGPVVRCLNLRRYRFTLDAQQRLHEELEDHGVEYNNLFYLPWQEGGDEATLSEATFEAQAQNIA